MAVVLSGVSVPVSGGDAEIREAAARKLGVGAAEIERARVKRQSLDCRKKDIRLVYTLHVALRDKSLQKRLENKFGAAEEFRLPNIEYGDKPPERPVVVGAGPAGLFAALTLARHGYKPLLIERGSAIPEREADIERLKTKGVFDPESNVCFGAGGAGAFSDGKLGTRIKDMRAEYVLETLAECGAPEQILISAKPHAGTDYIRPAVTRIIEKITEAGGEVSFNSRLSGIAVSDGEVCGITYIKSGISVYVETRAVVLAIGHSARDTYEMLHNCGIELSPKPFAIGVRIEHKREFIDRAQYGEAFSHPALGAAEYRLADSSGGRGVYTFCMCPGGEVICSATEEGGVAVNGMSLFAREGENSNSAVVVAVRPEDFPSGALGGVEFQRRWERAAYAKSFGAPVQTLGDFIAGKVSSGFGEVKPSYGPYTYFKDLSDCLPGFAAAAIAEGLSGFGRKLKGFDMPEAVLTGVETRTSAPVRITRGNSFEAAAVRGLFPAGEGAGYAGGIVSAAVDGMKCAEALMGIYKRP